MKRDIAQKIHLLEPIVRIGKNGLTENTIKDIKLHLKKKRLIKVKMLKSFIGDKDAGKSEISGNKGLVKKKLAKELADKTDSELLKMVGFVVVLKKKEK